MQFVKWSPKDFAMDKICHIASPYRKFHHINGYKFFFSKYESIIWYAP